MKKRTLITVILLNTYCIAFSQQVGVEKRIYSIQTGLFGMRGHG